MNTITAEIKGHFLRLYAMAFTDSNFHSAELDMLYKFAEDRGVSREDLHAVLTSPLTETSIPEDLKIRIDYLYDFACMAWADGQIVEDEENTLRKYCKLFEIEDEAIDDFLVKLLDSTNPENKRLKSDFINDLNL
ncbi:MAG: hypothetical protein QNK85_05665 [Crocinitomicaceae bacterium]|jgi:uncharacterized tellurite resistance protein B-like protein